VCFCVCVSCVCGCVYVCVSVSVSLQSVDAAVDFDAWVKWEDKGEDAAENDEDQGDEDQADNFEHALGARVCLCVCCVCESIWDRVD